MQHWSVLIIHVCWFCCLLLVCFVGLFFAMLRHRHILPCRKLCQNRGHAKWCVLIVWQASQHWWVPIQVLCQLCHHPVIFLFIKIFPNLDICTHILSCSLTWKCHILFLVNTCFVPWHALLHHRPEVIFPPFPLQTAIFFWRNSKHTRFPLLQIQQHFGVWSTSTTTIYLPIDCNGVSSLLPEIKTVSHQQLQRKIFTNPFSSCFPFNT